MRPVRGSRSVTSPFVALITLTLAATGCGSSSSDAEAEQAATSSDPAEADQAAGTLPSGGVPADAPTPTEPEERCCDEGDLDLFITAKTSFDRFAEAPYWDWIDTHYDAMVVWSPFWDSRLVHYDDVVAYTNAYSIKVNTDSDPRSKEHPEWLLRDTNGDPVYIPWGCDTGCPQFAADIGNPAFVDDWIASVQDLEARGYPGVLIDDVNMAWRFSDVNGDDIAPIDPRTGDALTLDDWQHYMADFTERVRREFPRLEIWHNSIWYVDSPDFDNDAVTRQIAAADVIQLERGMTDEGLAGGTGQFGMQTFMTFIDRVHALGARVALLDETATDDADQWYNIAGGLLVNEGEDLVTTEHWDSIFPENLFEGYLVDLGAALGPREVVADTIRREFTGGLVIMNEPGADATTLSLDEEWLSPEGEALSEVTLGPSQAIVMTRP